MVERMDRTVTGFQLAKSPSLRSLVVQCSLIIDKGHKQEQSAIATCIVSELTEPSGPYHHQAHLIVVGVQEAQNVGDLFKNSSDQPMNSEESKLCILSLLGPELMKSNEHGSDHFSLIKCTVQGTHNTKYIKGKNPAYFEIELTSAMSYFKSNKDISLFEFSPTYGESLAAQESFKGHKNGLNHDIQAKKTSTYIQRILSFKFKNLHLFISIRL